MTKEEAIKIIDHLGVKGSQDYSAHEIGEALTMAIEALKYQTPNKGEWEVKFIGYDFRYVCPFCSTHQERDSNFCPNCGADNRGENN